MDSSGVGHKQKLRRIIQPDNDNNSQRILPQMVGQIKEHQKWITML